MPVGWFDDLEEAAPLAIDIAAGGHGAAVHNSRGLELEARAPYNVLRRRCGLAELAPTTPLPPEALVGYPALQAQAPHAGAQLSGGGCSYSQADSRAPRARVLGVGTGEVGSELACVEHAPAGERTSGSTRQVEPSSEKWALWRGIAQGLRCHYL